MDKSVEYYLSKGYDPKMAEYFSTGRRRITSVVPNDDYTLTLTFDNGEVRLYDVSPILRAGTVFEPFRKLENFRRVYLDENHSVCWDIDPAVDSNEVWSNKVDLCPDGCYVDSVPVKTTRKPIYGNIPVVVNDEQIAEMRELYAKIRHIKYNHAYAMLTLGDTTKEERVFFVTVGELNNGRSYEEEQAEVERTLQLIDEGVYWSTAQNRAQKEYSVRFVSIYLTGEEKRVAERYATAKGMTLPDAFKEALFEKIEDEYDSAVAEDAYAEYVASGCKATPINELWKELDHDEEQPNAETVVAIEEVEENLQGADREAELTDQRYSAQEVMDAVRATLQGEDLTFKSSLTMEEIEQNFANVSVFEEIMQALNDTLEYEKGNLDLKVNTRTLSIDDEAADPFFSERNMEFLRRGVEALNTGKGVEHEIIDIHDHEKAQASLKLMDELEKGRKSGEQEGWLSLEDVMAHLRKSKIDSVADKLIEENMEALLALAQDDLIDPSPGTKLTPEECREEFFKMVGMEVYCDEPNRVVPDDEMPEFEGKTWAEVRQETELTLTPSRKKHLDNGEESKIL